MTATAHIVEELARCPIRKAACGETSSPLFNQPSSTGAQRPAKRLYILASPGSIACHTAAPAGGQQRGDGRPAREAPGEAA